MKRFVLILIFFFVSSCGGGGSSATNTSGFTVSGNLTLADGSATTSSLSVNYALSSLSGSSAVAYYLLTESTSTPAVDDSGWSSLETPSTSPSSLSGTFSLSASTGSHTVYAWFKSSSNEVATSALSTNIQLNVTSLTASLSLNQGASTSTQSTITATLSALSNSAISQYNLSESTTAPDSGWVSVSGGSSSLSNSASFVLSSSDGSKTVFLYVRDQAGKSATAQATIILDTTKPTGTLLIDGGNKLTQSSTITFTLTATDSISGIVAYAYTTSSTALAASSSSWTSIIKTTSLNRTSDTATLSTPLSGKKTYYAWLKDAAGNVSAALTDDIEVLKIFTTNSANNVGQYSSIALDSDDAPYISTYRATSTNLSYFIFDDATQTLSHGTVEDIAGVNLGTYTSIAVDSNNHLHIAYRDETNSKLKYATNASGSWVKETIESGGLSASIAVDNNNKIHIAHVLDGATKIRYVTNASGAWVGQDALVIAGLNLSRIAVSSSGVVHIVGNIPALGVYYGNSANAWSVSHLATLGTGISIAIDDQQRPVVGLVRNGKIAVATSSDVSGNTWTYDEISSANSNSVDIILDSNNKIHLVYDNSTTGALNYTTNFSGSWVTTLLDTVGGVNLYCGIEIDNNDRIHISYYDPTNQQLKYATTAETN